MWFPAVQTDSDYRFRAVEDLVKLSKELNLNITFAIGPYNAIMAKQIAPQTMEEYENVHQDLIDLFNNNQMPFVDLWEVGFETYTFADIQHHRVVTEPFAFTNF